MDIEIQTWVEDLAETTEGNEWFTTRSFSEECLDDIPEYFPVFIRNLLILHWK